MSSSFGHRSFVARRPRTRKHRSCSLCGYAIEPGDRVDAWMWKDGADVSFVEVHEPCEVLRLDMDIGEWTEGTLSEYEDDNLRVLAGLARMRDRKEAGRE